MTRKVKSLLTVNGSTQSPFERLLEGTVYNRLTSGAVSEQDVPCAFDLFDSCSNRPLVMKDNPEVIVKKPPPQLRC